MPFIVAVVLASMTLAGVGYTSQIESAQDTGASVGYWNDAVLGTWEGTVDPPEDAPPEFPEINFTMELEDDGGSIVGTFTINVDTPQGEMSFDMEIIDGEYDDGSGEFTCEIIPPDGDENGVMTATIDGDDIEGVIEGGGEESAFSGSRG
ncbi:MAG: hypothetical protein ACF8GE_01185 [Phycisphaerales bacterium JB043]